MARLDPLDSHRCPSGYSQQQQQQQQQHNGKKESRACNSVQQHEQLAQHDQEQEQQQQQQKHHHHQGQQGQGVKHQCDGGAQNGSSAPHTHDPQPKSNLPYRHFFCISPDACTNPTLFYLGDYLEAGQVRMMWADMMGNMNE